MLPMIIRAKVRVGVRPVIWLGLGVGLGLP